MSVSVDDLRGALALLGASPELLTEGERSHLDEDGFVVLAGLLDRDHVDALRQRYDELVAIEGEQAGGEFHQEVGPFDWPIWSTRERYSTHYGPTQGNSRRLPTCSTGVRSSSVRSTGGPRYRRLVTRACTPIGPGRYSRGNTKPAILCGCLTISAPKTALPVWSRVRTGGENDPQMY